LEDAELDQAVILRAREAPRPRLVAHHRADRIGGVPTGQRRQIDPPAIDSWTEDTTMRADLVVGSRFPDLVLPDHRRNPVQLSALAGGYPLIVSFYRGYW
jgi:hypothetical protein